MIGDTYDELNIMNDLYTPFKKPLAVNGYAMLIEKGKAGRITNKYREDGKTMWGISWDKEYPSIELARLTPAEYKALPESAKITSYETAPAW